MVNKKLKISKLKTEYIQQFYDSGIMTDIIIIQINGGIRIKNNNRQILFNINHLEQIIYYDAQRVFNKIQKSSNLKPDEDTVDLIQYVINNKFKLNYCIEHGYL